MKKELSLDEVKVGMVVSLSEICEIMNVPIILKRTSMNYSTGDPTGEVVYVGDDYPSHVDMSNIVIALNTYNDYIEGGQE